MHSFGNEHVSVTVKAEGAELTSFACRGRELLWQAGPAWPRHAPMLFPIVGRLAGDTLHHEGRDHAMTQHGFARDRRFDWVERGQEGCRLRLMEDRWSLERFPFRFVLEVDYRLDGPTLSVAYRVGNPGDVVLPASIGAHPAFVWPLAAGIDKAAHRLVFETEEPAPIRRVAGGLLRPEPLPSPIVGRVLELDDALFVDDAVILDRPASQWVRYEADGAPSSVTVGWHGMEQLGVWSKPGADFVCIEPWHGMASPADFDGAFDAKPHLMLIEPGGERRLGWSVAAGR